MADAFAFASGMAQSHAGGSVSSRQEAERYVKARPVTPKPKFEVLYPPRERCRLHREEKIHCSGGVNRVAYEVVEDSQSKCLIVAPYNLSKETRMRGIFLDLERLTNFIDGVPQKPWIKHTDRQSLDTAIAKFVMGRLQLTRDSPQQQAIFVPRVDSKDDHLLEIPPPDLPDLVTGFNHPPLLLAADPAPASTVQTPPPTSSSPDDVSPGGLGPSPPQEVPPPVENKGPPPGASSTTHPTTAAKNGSSPPKGGGGTKSQQQPSNGARAPKGRAARKVAPSA